MYLPPEVCPAPPDPVPRAKSLWEVGKESAPKEMLKLPQSPTVAALLGDLQRAQGFEAKKVGCLTPKTLLGHQGLKFYAPHTEAWPLKHPSLDDDAQKIGVSKASFPKAPDALLESLDVRARSLVSMASHMDLFLGAAKPAIESEDARAVASLLQSSARAAKHVMATAMTMSTDIILSKRDATVALSSVLLGQGRDLLRAAPLQAHNLFGDKCAQVASADTAERQSQQLARFSLPSSNRPFGQKKKQQKQEVGEGGQTDDDLLETSKSSTADSDSDSSSGCSNMSGEESWRPISGPMSWVYRHIEKGSDPRRILQQILPDDEFPKGLPPDIPEYVLWKLVISIVSEPPMRKKLTHVNTLSDVVHLMKTCSNIVVLTGAGVSVSCGIPDFRSRNGIYARLAVDFPDLPDPQAMFDINYFRNDQRPFFKFAKEIYPGQFEPSKCHKFIQLIEEHGKLLRNYTQNIDTLEQVAGIQNIIQCHGSFATAKCMLCRYKCTAEDIKEPIMQQVIPRCPKCPDDWPNAVMKPDIVFFGESLPEEFHNQMAADKDKCDLLIVIGSSLKVRPVALIPNSLPADIPQILINKELLKGQRFDVELLGDCDMIVGELCRQLGDSWDVLSGSGGGSELTEISVGMLLTPPATPADTDCEVGPTRTVDTEEFSINGRMQDDCSAKRNKFTDNKTVELPNTSEHRQLTNEVENNKLDEKAADLHLSVEDQHESHKSSIHSQQSCSDLGQVAGSEQIDSSSSTQLSNTSVPHDHVATESCSPGGGEMKDGDSSTEHTCLPEPSTDHDSEAASDKIKSGQGNCGNISDIPDQSVYPDSGENCAKTSDVEAFDSKASTSRDNNNGCVTSSAVKDKTLVNDARTNLNNAATTSTANLSQGDSDTSESSRTERMMCRKTSESESGVAYGDRETCGTSSSVDELRKMWKPAVARISVSKRLGENQYCFMPPSRYVFTDAEVYTKLETDSDNDMEDDNNTSASAHDHDTDTEMESGLTDANTSMNSTKNTIELAGEMDSSLPTDVSDGTDIDNVPSNDSATLEGGDNLGDLGPRL